MLESRLPVTDVPPKGTRLQKIQSAMIGALYGLLAGTAFVLMSAFIDSLLHPDLPLGVDWSLVAIRWALIGLGLALIGALTSLFDETWAGLLAGAVTAGVLALTSALFLSSTSAGLKLMVLVFTLAPIAVISLPIAWILRRLAESHTRALYSTGSITRISLLILIAVALGVTGGYFMKMPRNTVAAVRYFHEALQDMEAETGQELRDLTGFEDHVAMGYKLFQRESAVSTEGYDVRAEYADGYIVQCVVVVYPGSDPYIASCESNEK
ncbi:MAG: hypothetical protein L0287_17535 [Anaerolineae bacterium]|nr:hypothetical protein [Anaerolineae bacterium]